MVRIRNATRGAIADAIGATAEQFGGNIIPNRFDTMPAGTTHFVTIKVRDSRGPGARTRMDGSCTISACWHAWGVFFDEVFMRCPDAVIVALGDVITRDEGNWIDLPVGRGVWRSEQCHCVGFENHTLRVTLAPGVVLPTTPPIQIPTTTTRYDIPHTGVEQDSQIELKPKRFEDEVV